MAISPQFTARSRALIEKQRFGFEILRDDGNKVAAAYGLRWTLSEELKQLYLQFGLDLPAGNGDDSWTLPLPARYIINQRGTIVHARTGTDYTHRPEPEETVEALRRLG